MNFNKNKRLHLKLDSSIISKVGDDVALSIRQSCHDAKRDGFQTAIVDVEIKYTFME